MLYWRYQAFPLLCVNITEFVLLLIMSFWSNKAPGLATVSFQRVVPSGDLVLGTWKAESTWPLVDGFDRKSMNPYVVGDMPKSPSSQYGLKAQVDIDPKEIRVTNGPIAHSKVRQMFLCGVS